MTVLASSSSVSSLRSNQEKVKKVNSRSNEAFVVDCSDAPVRSRANSARIQNNWTDHGNNCENGNEIGVDEGEAAAKEEEPSGTFFSIAAIVKAKQLARKLAEKHQKEGDIHMIDRLCRILFPVTFIAFNIIYFVIVTSRES